MFQDFARKSQITFQDPASPIAEGIVDLHNEIFFWLLFIFIPVLVIFFRIIKKSNNIWSNPTIAGIKKRALSIHYLKLIHGTFLEIIWTVTPTIILILIAIPSFKLIYSMESIIDPDMTIKVIGNQWYWTYDYNFHSFLLRDTLNIYNTLAELMVEHGHVLWTNFVDPQHNYRLKPMSIERTALLWDHNIKNYIIDSYTLPETLLTEKTGVRLLSVDNPIALPLNTNIRVLVTSSDVLHSFAVPSLGIKLDATPGRLGATSLFIERPGQFFGQCSELCGVQHGYMSTEIYGIEPR